MRNGKPVALILNIDRYQEMLERLEEIEDLKALVAMREKPIRFWRFADFLAEQAQNV